MLNTCGPWRKIRLEKYSARIEDLRVEYDVVADLKSLAGTITVTVEGSAGKKVVLTARFMEEVVFRDESEVNSDGEAKVNFHIGEPRLWYPHGYGAQSLYEVTVVLEDGDGHELHRAARRTGFRRGELVQDPDDVGKTFYFRINGVDVFCGGSDWIPADSFTPRITEDIYRKWLQMMVDGYQVMIRYVQAVLYRFLLVRCGKGSFFPNIRIWGGGIWEEDVFYDLCDELGVLVWQDFMFGCGNYPAYPDFLRSVEAECIANLRRIRHHPSILVYAGNNEDYQVQEQFGLTYDYMDKNPENWLNSNFPARFIYEKVRHA